MSDSVAEWFIKQIEAHGLTAVALAGGALTGAGFVIGWLITQRSALATYGKTNAETAEIREKLFQQLEASRTALNSQTETHSLRLREFRDKLGQWNSQEIHEAREELCRAYDADYLPKLKSYLEQIPRLLGRKERLLRLKSDILPAIHHMNRVLTLVNEPRLLKMIGDPAPAKLLHRPSELEVLFARINELHRIWHRDVVAELAALHKSLFSHTRPATQGPWTGVARSMAAFAGYLIVSGFILLMRPDALLAALGFPATHDFWPRVTGVLVLCLAIYYLVAARSNLTPLIHATVFMRIAVFGLFGALVLLSIAPRPLALLGLIDLIAAIWTAIALKSERSG